MYSPPSVSLSQLLCFFFFPPLGVLCVSIEMLELFISFVKNPIGISIGIALNLQIALGNIGISTILIFQSMSIECSGTPPECQPSTLPSAKLPPVRLSAWGSGSGQVLGKCTFLTVIVTLCVNLPGLRAGKTVFLGMSAKDTLEEMSWV